MAGDQWKQRRALITPGLTISRVRPQRSTHILENYLTFLTLSQIKTVYPVTTDVCGKMTEFIKKQIRIGPKDGINGKEVGCTAIC